MFPALSPVKDFNDPFLLAVYASTRDDEMTVVPWTDEQKQAFLKMQSQAQHNYYLEKHPDASYQIISLNENPVGRLYVLRLADRIRILDITVLPEYRNQGVAKKILSEILEEASEGKKAVQIYIESFNLSANFFARQGFKPVKEEGFHVLWEWKPSPTAAKTVGA